MVAPVKEMKWMILGGGGQLARALSMELSRTNAAFISLNHAQLDITNQSDIEKWFTSEAPDVVVNAAAWTDVDSAEAEEEKAFTVNALGPKLLAQACSQNGTKFIQISTDYVFSGAATSPWEETDPVNPVSAYGRTKAQGESFVLDAYAEGAFILRTAWLYSPWRKNFVKTVLKVALNETRKVEIVADQIGQPTSAMDLARQIQQLVILEASPGIYHATNAGQASWFELAQKLFRLSGQDQNRVIAVGSSAFPRPAKRPAFSVLGHRNWICEGLQPMRNWQDALEEALPDILQAVKRGE